MLEYINFCLFSIILSFNLYAFIKIRKYITYLKRMEQLIDNLILQSGDILHDIDNKNQQEPAVKVENNKNQQKEHAQRDPFSAIAGVDNLTNMIKDINSSYLISNGLGEVVSNVGFGNHTSMQILGSHFYERFGYYLAPLDLFCILFKHLDWDKFAQIAHERRKETEQTITKKNRRHEENQENDI